MELDYTFVYHQIVRLVIFGFDYLLILYGEHTSLDITTSGF